MTTKRMLVDASHPEETRIVITSGSRLDEFDFEAANKRQLRGNIYLAKVTRVEPSLQAAFVEYGGNRHGFLAFSEIHPDYYQIPKADREALMRAEAEAVKLEAIKLEAAEKKKAEAKTSTDDVSDDKDAEALPDSDDAAAEENSRDAENDGAEEKSFDDLGGGEGEDLLETRRAQTRRYKIQEVIKRRQVLLIQVVKEERGNKGAALTTYLSLAGRYSVLMPNTARGGGISRKITSGTDRKRLKQIASDLSVPAGMGVILRTAGASRTKAEIKRDFEYLSRLWENVRQLTMKSSAPSLVYEEGSLIKRTIRDLYNKEISEVLVAGDEAYREAKDFMQLIMPSHAKNVKAYKEPQHLFSRYNAEAQLDSMFSPQVTLPSGGYIVINPTEALVSIDVNSGRATKEHNIEATALQTNLEAAEEAARQFRLRDLAGLIVIDFIDMTERRSIRAVEKRLKDSLKNDRARIQIGRISHFGLLEMSRQRMRFGVLESSTHACPACEGTGIIRAVESRALMVMRALEDHVVRKPGNSVDVKVPTEVALYLLNSKRSSLIDLEASHKLSITISADTQKAASEFAIERGEDRYDPLQAANSSVRVDSAQPVDAVSETAPDEDNQPQRKRRRRKSSGASNTESGNTSDNNTGTESSSEVINTSDETDTPEAEQDDQPRKRRRRGRRGGRRNRRNTNDENGNQTDGAASLAPENPVKDGAETNTDANSTETAEATNSSGEQSAEVHNESTADAPEETRKRPAKRRSRRPAKKETATPVANGADNNGINPQSANSPSDKSNSMDEAKAPVESKAPVIAAETKSAPPSRPSKPIPEEGVIVTTSNTEAEAKPRRKGWWSRG